MTWDEMPNFKKLEEITKGWTESSERAMNTPKLSLNLDELVPQKLNIGWGRFNEGTKLFGMLLISTLILLSLSPRDSYAEIGLASWYSTETCKINPNPGCPTASGRSLYELEKEKIPFAASWNYPLGSRVRVTSLETGKSAEVLIVDRGPNKRLRNRVIDLSKNAFEKIGNSNRGLIEVEVQSVRRVQEAA